MSFNVHKIREEFPILQRELYNKPFVYFDNAATTQKPLRVIERLNSVYRETNSNIHRGVHHLSEITTRDFENARESVKNFLNARSDHEIIFTAGTTAAINLVAYSYGERFINKGDEIIISALEHHANIVPWQMLCERKGAILKIIPIDDDGNLIIDKLPELITGKTRLLAVTHVSNSTGTLNPVKDIIKIGHDNNLHVLIDGAQAVQHMKIDVVDLDADFYLFSGHKMYAPTGIGVLYGKEELLNEMPPYQTGGEMVDQVSFERTTFNRLPFKFEAGTPNYTGAIGLAEAINFLAEAGFENIAAYEKELVNYAVTKLEEIEGLILIGKPLNRVSVISFLLDGIHPFDAGMVLDKLGIAVRTGTHCAQPVMDRLGVRGTIRASLALYNTKEEVDILVEGIKKVLEMFR